MQNNPSCATCVWLDRFTPRPDEIARAQLIGCTKPGWEGYTSLEHMSCGGTFYRAQADHERQIRAQQEVPRG